MATPLERLSIWYQARRAELGDDWCLDVLASDDATQVAILAQLGA